LEASLGYDIARPYLKEKEEDCFSAFWLRSCVGKKKEPINLEGQVWAGSSLISAVA
jgi:hypothetical protein